MERATPPRLRTAPDLPPACLPGLRPLLRGLRAPPGQLGGSPQPSELASDRPKLEDSPPSTARPPPSPSRSSAASTPAEQGRRVRPCLDDGAASARAWGLLGLWPPPRPPVQIARVGPSSRMRPSTLGHQVSRRMRRRAPATPTPPLLLSRRPTTPTRPPPRPTCRPSRTTGPTIGRSRGRRPRAGRCSSERRAACAPLFAPLHPSLLVCVKRTCAAFPPPSTNVFQINPLYPPTTPS